MWLVFQRWNIKFLMVLLCINFLGCKISGIGLPSVSSGMQTIYIQPFKNEARLIVPYLADEFNNQIQDYFQKKSNFRYSNQSPDIEISGKIINYEISPINIARDGVPAQNRLTITVWAELKDLYNPNHNWSKKFTRFADIERGEDFSLVERKKINEVLGQVIEDIFTKSTGPW